jgi:hypothetical protein
MSPRRALSASETRSNGMRQLLACRRSNASGAIREPSYAMGFTLRGSCLYFQGSATGMKRTASYPVAHQPDRHDQQGERAAHQHNNGAVQWSGLLLQDSGASWAPQLARQRMKKAACGTGARRRLVRHETGRASAANG